MQVEVPAYQSNQVQIARTRSHSYLPLAQRPAWFAYKDNPNERTLAYVLGASPIDERETLSLLMEDLFRETNNWHIAYHLALLHLDRLSPNTNQSDLIRALYFALEARELSSEDSRACLAAALVSWERRLPLAILHDVEMAMKAAERLRAETDEARFRLVVGRAYLLEGMARAYLHEVDKAIKNLTEAERRGCLTVEVLFQLLMVSEPDHPFGSLWAVARMPRNVNLGGRGEVIFKQGLRRRFVVLLDVRGRMIAT